MMTQLDKIASDIMLDAYSHGGFINRCPLGFGYEDLDDNEKSQIIKVIEKYGNIREKVPFCTYFNEYELNQKGMDLHEQYDSYQNYLAYKEQSQKEKELDIHAKKVAIETQKEAVELSKQANAISIDANRIAENAIAKAKTSNTISIISLSVSIIAIIVSIILHYLDQSCI